MKKDWTYKKLGEVATIYDSQRKPVTKKDRKPGPYPYYGATGVQDYVDKYIFDGRYVLVGEDGARWSSNEKSAYIIEGKSWVNNHAHVLSFDNSIIDCFIVYYLNYSNLDSYITGAIIKKLTQKDLLSISIPIPPLSIQRSIVAELDLLHSVISKKKEQLCELDNLAQSLFYQMFGDPITNPMGWEIKKLGEVALEKLSYGSGASAIDFDNEVRYVRITDINDDGSLNENAVSPSVCEDKYLLHCGDILFARTGATVGKTYLHLESAIKCIYAGYLIRFIPNIDIINPLYAFHFTKTQYYHDFVAQAQRAVAQPNINAQQYSNLPLPLPPLSLQQSFAAKVSAIEAQKQAITQSIKETEALLVQRMDTYFS